MSDPERVIRERRGRRRGALLAALIFAGILGASVLSVVTWAGVSTPQTKVYLTAGRLNIERDNAPRGNWSAWMRGGSSVNTTFEWASYPTWWYARIPVWGPLAVSGFFFWAFAYRFWTHREHDHCKGCGYTLRGLKSTPDAPRRCPECGREDREGA